MIARRVPWHFVGAIAGVMFAFLGVVAGFAVYSQSEIAFRHLEATRAACLAGNERACRIYEIEWGRR